MPGGQVNIDGTVRAAPGSTIDGSLTTAANVDLGTPKLAERVTLKSGAFQTFHLSFRVAASTSLGTYPVTLVLSSGGSAISSRKIRVDVKLPVTVAAVTPDVVQPDDEGNLAVRSIKVSLWAPEHPYR